MKECKSNKKNKTKQKMAKNCINYYIIAIQWNISNMNKKKTREEKNDANKKYINVKY